MLVVTSLLPDVVDAVVTGTCRIWNVGGSLELQASSANSVQDLGAQLLQTTKVIPAVIAPSNHYSRLGAKAGMILRDRLATFSGF